MLNIADIHTHTPPTGSILWHLVAEPIRLHLHRLESTFRSEIIRSPRLRGELWTGWIRILVSMQAVLLGHGIYKDKYNNDLNLKASACLCPLASMYPPFFTVDARDIPRLARQWTLTSNAAGRMWSCSLAVAFFGPLVSYIGEDWVQFSCSYCAQSEASILTQTQRYCFCQPSHPRFTQPSCGNALTLHTDLMRLAHHDMSCEIF